MAKKINHREHRALLFLCALCGYKPFQEIIKSLKKNNSPDYLYIRVAVSLLQYFWDSGAGLLVQFLRGHLDC